MKPRSPLISTTYLYNIYIFPYIIYIYIYGTSYMLRQFLPLFSLLYRIFILILQLKYTNNLKWNLTEASLSREWYVTTHLFRVHHMCISLVRCTSHDCPIHVSHMCTPHGWSTSALHIVCPMYMCHTWLPYITVIHSCPTYIYISYMAFHQRTIFFLMMFLSFCERQYLFRLKVEFCLGEETNSI